MNIYDAMVLHKCVSTEFLQTWDNNNTFYFKVRRHSESISFWREKKRGQENIDANSRNAADLMIQRQDCREISGSQVGMTHHAETVVRADVKGWLRDPDPSCLSRGEGQTQQKGSHTDKRSRARLTRGALLLRVVFAKNSSLGCPQVLNLGLGEIN